MNQNEYKRQNHELEQELLVILLALLVNMKSDLKLQKDIRGLISALESNILTINPVNAALVTRARSIIQKASANGYEYGPGAISHKNYNEHETRLNYYIAKLDVGLRKNMLLTALAGIYLSSNFETIHNTILTSLNAYTPRLKSMASTEVMNASNSSSLEQARANGVTHYTVKFMDDACSMCLDEYEGMVFNIEDTDMLPPLHPNCRCYPIYTKTTTKVIKGEILDDSFS